MRRITSKYLAKLKQGERSIGVDARVQANLLIDGTAIGLEGPGMPPFDLAKHRADEPVEEIDGLVCQIGDQVERNGDQGRMTALTFVAGDMLYRGTAGLAGELGKAALMHAMSEGGIDADCANMVQTLDQAQHRGRLCVSIRPRPRTAGA